MLYTRPCLFKITSLFFDSKKMEEVGGWSEKVKKIWPVLLDGDGGGHRSLTRPFPTYPKHGPWFLALGLDSRL